MDNVFKMKSFLHSAFVFIAAGIISACNNNIADENTDEAPNTSAAGQNQTVVSLTPEQIRTIGIEYGSIEQKELTNSIKASGILKVPNQNKAFVTPSFSGVVKTLQVEPGSYVRKGQTIATIFNPDLLEKQQDLHQLNLEIELSEKEAARQKELVEGNAAPLKKLQQVQTELATLKSRRDALKRQLGGMGVSESYSANLAVKAPIAGTISKVDAQIGSSVDISSPIAEIVNNSLLHLDIFIYERDLPKIKVGQTIHFTITNNPEKEYDATIFSIGSAFEPGSKTIPVHAHIRGDKTGLIDGMNITALVSLDVSTLPAVPSSAIITDEGKDFIFIVDDSMAKTGAGDLVYFRKIPVVRGATDVGFSEVTPLEKIPAGATVVTKGSFFILGKITNTSDHAH